ncbi:BamA/TamA family outer membrane protein [Marinigracilibium pacificum]|uniref:Bacterial surface antigen (D15) domain-containing protein n=1 Tax=Marinigracilibium pacificum TaxID=2729599 RepID=A0A848IY23_9BACT|nr:hypothetical protein [Marinigracilibium pacificum]NMM47144.1 hypothetical protein [Marinigracilibium pacificum]
MYINTAQVLGVLFCLTYSFAFGQNYSIKVQNTDLHYEIVGSDSADLSTIIKKYKKAGYSSIDIDTLYLGNSVVYSINSPLIINPKYILVKDYVSGDTLEFSEVHNWNQFSELRLKILNNYLNNGYPFCQLRFSSNDIHKNTFSYLLNKGRRIYFDTLRINNSNQLNNLFLSKYLQIKPGSEFDQSKIEEINNRMSRLTGWDIQSIDTMIFRLGNAEPYISIKRKNKDYLDFFVGLTNNNSGTVFTGQASLGLFNLFKTGRVLQLEWQRVRAGSQYLLADYYHPYLFSPLFSGEAKLEIIKADSTYNRVRTELKVFGNAGGKVMYGVGYYYEDNSAISNKATENGIRPSDKVNINGILLSADYNSRYSIPEGEKVSFYLDFVFGRRVVKDSVFSESGSWIKAYSNISFKEKINNRLEVKLGLTGLYAPLKGQKVNEAFRFGGINEFRGIPQKALSLEQGASFQSELRLLLERNSFLFMHLDGGVFREYGLGTSYPVSAGPGMSIKFNSGTLDLAFTFLLNEPYAFSSNVPLMQVGYRANL